MIKTILQRPFPLNHNLKRKFITAGCFGLFVIVFLFLFKPFQLDQLGKERFVIASIAYGVITFSCIIFMVAAVPAAFPEFFKEEKWTVGKQIFYILCIIFFIGLINYLLSYFIVDSSLKFENILRFQFITISIGILPIIIHTLIKQNQQLKKYASGAASLQKKISEINAADHDKKKAIDGKAVMNDLVVIKGDYQKEEISVQSDDLLYVSAANNYVKVYYLENDKVVYSILRITMKRIEDALLPFPDFFRCHRTYIINLQKVKEVSGNAQGYKVKLDEVDEMIPVSRSLNAEFSDKLLSKKPVAVSS